MGTGEYCYVRSIYWNCTCVILIWIVELYYQTDPATRLFMGGKTPNVKGRLAGQAIITLMEFLLRLLVGLLKST